jgi:hypothetical protein
VMLSFTGGGLESRRDRSEFFVDFSTLPGTVGSITA